ncbi:MAG: DUF3987 domain-containing protein [Methylococcales bacterium]
MNTNYYEIIADFKDFAQTSAGIELPPDLITDGKLHRFKINGEKSGKLSGAYTLHLDGKPAGYVQYFRTDTKLNWTFKGDYQGEPISQADIKQKQQQAEKEQAKIHAEKAKLALDIYRETPAHTVEKHPYVVAKGIDCFNGNLLIKCGLWKQRNWQNALIIPLVDKSGNVVSIQAINENLADNKDLLKGGKKQGCFYPFATLEQLKAAHKIMIGEGLATVGACFDAMGYIIPAVSAVDVGNLLAVAKVMRELNPTAILVILADNDIKTNGTPNIGLETAFKIRREIDGCVVAIPSLGNDEKCDFWDLWHKQGSEAVKAVIEKAVNGNALNTITDTPTPKTEPLTDQDNGSFNNTLDTESHYCSVEFLQFVDDKHILKQLSLNIAKATYLPPHTVFLMGLGVFSSVACRRYCVEYQHGGIFPIGLYAIGEQPPAMGKSWAMNTFQEPFYTAEKAVKNQTKERLSALYAIDKKELTPEQEQELQNCQKVLKSVLFTTNTTAEALEQSLSHSGGYFSAVSSEQGLFNTILGYCYSDKASNNDLLLNGFDGGYMGSLRVSRDGYYGAVVGGAVMFAQNGGIENLLKASNGTGLAERFLFIAEPHNLGTRDFTQTAIINHDLTNQYSAICEVFASYVISEPLPFSELSRLDICADGWRLIAEYRNSIEKHLADGGRYSHIAIRGAAGKVNMQIMKIAANLHLLDGNKTTTIDLKHVKAAIGIVGAMIEANLRLCRDKGIIGTKAEYTSILTLFQYDNKPKVERAIIQAKIQTKPFSDFTGNRSKLVVSTLKDMIDDGILQVTFLSPKSENAKPVKAYTLA